MREANRKGVLYTVIVAEGELERGAVTVRDMVQGNQVEVPLDDVIAWLKEELV